MENKKRLIDANALCKFFQERYEYLRNASEERLPHGFVRVDTMIQGGAIIAKGFLDKAKQAPTVEAVEVVRCLHCQYAKPYERVDGLTGYYCQHPKNTFQYGTNWERLFEPIKGAWDYCSYGERREGE